MESFGWLKKVG